MDRERSSLYLGLGILTAGIAILAFVLVTVIGIAANPGPFIERQINAGSQNKAPAAAFTWSSQGTFVTFTDHSSSGGAAITSYSWDFGDGQTSTERSPSHSYLTNGIYTITLTARDQNSLSSSATTNANVQSSGGNNGGTYASALGSLDLGNLLLPIAIAVLTTGLYLVAAVCGGALVRAGWNLIRPRPETIRIRLRPQNWEMGATAEVVPPRAMTMAPPPMIGPPMEPGSPPTPPGA